MASLKLIERVFDAIKAIQFAEQAKAVLGVSAADVRILSNSWGGGGHSQSLLDEINAASAAEMIGLQP